MDNGLQGCPGWTLSNDQRLSEGKIFYEYDVTLIPQSRLEHRAVLPWKNKTIDIPVCSSTKEYPRDQQSYETKNPVDLKSFGPTTRGPMGWVVGGRSGDKAAGLCYETRQRNALANSNRRKRWFLRQKR